MDVLVVTQVSEKKGRRGFGFGTTPGGTIQYSPSVKRAYSIVSKCTGSLGGNGSGGAIYGELTVGSMQKVSKVMEQWLGIKQGD